MAFLSPAFVSPASSLLARSCSRTRQHVGTARPACPHGEKTAQRSLLSTIALPNMLGDWKGDPGRLKEFSCERTARLAKYCQCVACFGLPKARPLGCFLTLLASLRPSSSYISTSQQALVTQILSPEMTCPSYMQALATCRSFCS